MDDITQTSSTGSLATRHVRMGLAFSQELSLDLNVFLAFYRYARERIFIEALNFFLLVRSPCGLSTMTAPFLSLGFSFKFPHGLFFAFIYAPLFNGMCNDVLAR
jgi:hypothetical protein